MQSLIHNFSQADQVLPQLSEMKNIPLSDVLFHQDAQFLTRYFAEGFPAYIAVHEISIVKLPPAAYTQPHTHNDYNEINIILSAEKLIYKILLGSAEHIINNNSCIWIPKGTLHAANVLYGSGFFITIRL